MLREGEGERKKVNGGWVDGRAKRERERGRQETGDGEDQGGEGLREGGGEQKG